MLLAKSFSLRLERTHTFGDYVTVVNDGLFTMFGRPRLAPLDLDMLWPQYEESRRKDVDALRAWCDQLQHTRAALHARRHADVTRRFKVPLRGLGNMLTSPLVAIQTTGDPGRAYDWVDEKIIYYEARRPDETQLGVLKDIRTEMRDLKEWLLSLGAQSIDLQPSDKKRSGPHPRDWKMILFLFGDVVSEDFGLSNEAIYERMQKACRRGGLGCWLRGPEGE